MSISMILSRVRWVLRGFLRSRMTASLAVFEESYLTDPKRLVAYVKERDERETKAIRDFLRSARSDPEINGILSFYGASDLQIREVIALLIESALSPRDAIAVPFVLELCLYALAESNRQEMGEATRNEVWRAYKTCRFVNAEQRTRFESIFGTAAVRQS